jgi:hypothetical protein
LVEKEKFITSVNAFISLISAFISYKKKSYASIYCSCPSCDRKDCVILWIATQFSSNNYYEYKLERRNRLYLKPISN